jgi:hypothetical protein
MRNRVLRLLACREKFGALLFALVLTAVSSFAQMETATLSGTVMDQSGAVISDAQVEVTNSETNSTISTTTNTAGVYIVSALKPGRYRMFVRKQGFKQISVTDIVLNVQDVISRNFHLQLGAVSETISVTADSANVNVQDATVSTVVDRQFAEDLPMNGRSFQTLVQLTPGVVLTTSNQNDNGQFSVNGQRASANYWTVDGVGANFGVGVNQSGTPGNGLSGAVGSFSVQGGTNSLVSVDAMQEFRVQTSTYAPEFGRVPGAQISIVTRSGTNQVHGSAFDYLRNDKLDANDWFADRAGLPKPQERQNDFGGTLGGPIVKRHTFFFFSYEGLRLRLPQVAMTTVPDMQSRIGAKPTLQSYLNAYPLPNGVDLGSGVAAFDASFSNKSKLDAYSLRVDQVVNKTLNLFGRYNYSQSSFLQRGGGFGNALSTVNPLSIATQTFTFGSTWTIVPRAIDEFRLNFSRANAHSYYYLDSFGGAVPLALTPLQPPFTLHNGNFFFDIFSLEQGPLFTGEFERNVQRQINIVDSVSLEKGEHSLKFGVDYRRLSPVNGQAGYAQVANFLDVGSAENGNLFDSVVASQLSPTFLFRNLGIYAQDTWRALPKLTLTYGVRWDVDFVPQSLNGPTYSAITGLNLNNLSTLALARPGTDPYNTNWGAFAPRLGVAYQISQSQKWQSVLRGGLGVFYDLASSEAGNNILTGFYPFGSLTQNFGGTFPLSAGMLGAPPVTPPSTSNPGGLFAFDPHLKMPYTLEWNVALEQVVGAGQTVSASYVGAAGRRLLQTPFISSPNATFTFAQVVTNLSSSDYDALQLQFQKRVAHGMEVLASYSWSHSIDTGSAGSTAVFSNVVLPSDVRASRGPSDFDIRNACSLGFTYTVPTLKITPIATKMLGGWSLQSVVQARSAPPVDVSDIKFFQFNSGVAADIRPDVVAGQPFYLYGRQYPGGKALNESAFADPPIDPNTGNPLRQGTLSRNGLRGFGATQWDLAVHRDFPLRESLKLQFRAELFNVLNHPNFGPPRSLFGLGGFGLSNKMLGQSLNNSNQGGGGFSPLYQIGGPRSIQFALKLSF